jgi:hypothetical protein
VQETSWTDGEFGISHNWLEDIVAHLSALGERGKITSTAEGGSRPTLDDLKATTLTFEDMSVGEQHRTATTGSLTDVAEALAQGTLEQMRSNGSVAAHFMLGSNGGITEFHPLYRSLSINVTDLTGQTATRSLGSISEESD